MSEPRDAAPSGKPAQADEAVEPVTPGQWGTFRTRADQRRLAQVQAAKREREAARARPDVSLSLDAGPAPVRPQQAGHEVDSLATGDDRETFTILVVCTGNVCRSPYFERVLAADLAGLPVRVEGAGTGALLIERMSSGTQVLLRERGLDGALVDLVEHGVSGFTIKRVVGLGELSLGPGVRNLLDQNDNVCHGSTSTSCVGFGNLPAGKAIGLHPL